MAEFERVLRNTPTTLSCTFYGDETPMDADGTVSVTVTKADGTTLIGPVTATHDGDAGSGRYVLPLPKQADLNILTCEWSGVFGGDEAIIETEVEIVGGHYFTLAEARAVEGLADTTKYPTAKLVEKRLEVEVEFERACGGRAFVPRYGREIFDGAGRAGEFQISKPDLLKITSVTADGVAWTAEELAQLDYDWTGIGYSPVVFPLGTNNVAIEFEYGKVDKATRTDIRRVGLIRLKSLLIKPTTNIPDRAYSVAAEGGARFGLAMPGRFGYTTGIPDVDAILDRYSLDPRGYW